MAKKSVLDEPESILNDTFIASENYFPTEPDTMYTMAEDEIPVHEVPSVDDQTDNSASMFERPFIWDDHVNTCSLSPLYSVTRD